MSNRIKSQQAILSKLGIENISNIRIGKHVFLEIESNTEEDAKSTVKEICEKLLVNQITEKYDFILACSIFDQAGGVHDSGRLG